MHRSLIELRLLLHINQIDRLLLKVLGVQPIPVLQILDLGVNLPLNLDGSVSINCQIVLLRLVGVQGVLDLLLVLQEVGDLR